jgi:hypothetical protein
MRKSPTHFINREFIAPNVLEIDVDRGVLADLSAVSSLLQARAQVAGMVELENGLQLHASHPDWQSDVLWVSQADRAGYDYFEDIFRRLRIAESVAEKIAYDREIVLYSGFFVTRSFCDRPDFHYDWTHANNDAFTFLGPVSDNCGELGLLYKNLRGQESCYDYTPGKGLVFGDFFFHSTAPGRARGVTVLLSFTFGTDRMDNWLEISRTAAAQGVFYRRPDGQFVTLKQQPPGG